MIGRRLILQAGIIVFSLAARAQAHAEILAFDCSDKTGVYYNIWADLDQSKISIHYANPELSQQLRTFPAEISARSIRWSFGGSPKLSLTASIDRTTGRYVQVYGGAARGGMTLQCTRGSSSAPGLHF